MSENLADIRLGKRRRYSPTAGDEWIEVGSLRPAHRDRIFEARAESGIGYLGKIVDAEHHLIHGTVGIRFEGETLALFGNPDMMILLKPEGTEPGTELGDTIAETTRVDVGRPGSDLESWIIRFVDGRTFTVPAVNRETAIVEARLRRRKEERDAKAAERGEA